jgi:hypothetical protein
MSEPYCHDIIMKHHQTNTPRRLPRYSVLPSGTIGQLARWLAGLSALALLTACSSTHIQSSRIAAVPPAAPCHSVLVVAMDPRPDIRSQFEADMVYFLQQRKVEGIASYKQFAVSDFKGGQAEIRKKCAAAGADSVLMVRTTDRTSFGRAFPRSLGSLEGSTPDETTYELFTSGGNIETDMCLDVRLYRVSDSAPLWNALVDTLLKDQYDSRAVAWKVAKGIVTRLAKDKVIP